MGEGENILGMRTSATLLGEETFRQSLGKYIKSQCMVLSGSGKAGTEPKSIPPAVPQV